VANPIIVQVGHALTNATVATFTDANPFAAAGDFYGTINWGDGTTTVNFTAASVTASGANFVVKGSHVYTKTGQYTVSVVIKDVGGADDKAQNTKVTVNLIPSAAGVQNAALLAFVSDPPGPSMGPATNKALDAAAVDLFFGKS
jgi:hypothetical protein